MTWNPTSPVTGAPGTGLTSPTYTIVADIAPDVNGVARAVTTLGGTQTGVEISSPSNPFTMLATRPKVLRTLPSLLANGQLPSVPKNTWVIAVRKGVDVLAGQPKQVMLCKLEISVPAVPILLIPRVSGLRCRCSLAPSGSRAMNSVMRLSRASFK